MELFEAKRIQIIKVCHQTCIPSIYRLHSDWIQFAGLVTISCHFLNAHQPEHAFRSGAYDASADMQTGITTGLPRGYGSIRIPQIE